MNQVQSPEIHFIRPTCFITFTSYIVKYRLIYLNSQAFIYTIVLS